MINAIYKEPNYTIVDKDTTTDPRIQREGIRQGCPLSPYLFIIVMTAMFEDIKEDSNLAYNLIKHSIIA